MEVLQAATKPRPKDLNFHMDASSVVEKTSAQSTGTLEEERNATKKREKKKARWDLLKNMEKDSSNLLSKNLSQYYLSL